MRKLEQELFQKDVPKILWVNEMTIVNREKGRTKPTNTNIERIKEILEA
jgi:hypothetical protein